MRASAIVFLTAACGCATWTAREELPPVAPISSGAGGTATFQGSVVRSDGTPSDGWVQLFDRANRVMFGANLDPWGRFQLTEIPAGVYEVDFGLASFEEIELLPDAVVTREVTLPRFRWCCMCSVIAPDESLFSITTEEEQRLLRQPETRIGR